MHEWKDFTVLKKLGMQKKRKFGATYLVQRNDSSEQLVLKVVEHSGDFELAKQQLEAESKFSFIHKSLPTIVDFFSSQNESCLFLKFKEGIPLDEYFSKLKRKERIPFLKYFIKQLVPVFNELNNRSIVHCDIKPSNFLVDGQKKIHLIDFGLALNSSEENHRKLVFPLGYASPELLLNELSLVNQQTDFYALGTMIWRLFSGKIPLTHPNPSVFTNLQLNHPLPENDSISRKLQRILEYMTCKHSFALPPNRMKREDVILLLETAKSNRPKSIEEINQMIQGLPDRRRWF